jgi:8-oxo-dGTP pyrophosphatase MutT (NUDIX family)
MTGGTRDKSQGVPHWLRRLLDNAALARPEELSRFVPPAEGGRESAVLLLFGEGPDGPDVLLIERADTLRSHAGQPAFPGGAADPADVSPADTALREAAEEVGLDSATVRVVAMLPALFLPPTGFVVTPVVAWWHTRSPVGVANPREVARVEAVPIRELVEPANRCRLRHPSGYVGAAFTVRDMVVWGFTAGLLDRVLELGGWAVPWDTGVICELPPSKLDLAMRARAPVSLDDDPVGPYEPAPAGDEVPATRCDGATGTVER